MGGILEKSRARFLIVVRQDSDEELENPMSECVGTRRSGCGSSTKGQIDHKQVNNISKNPEVRTERDPKLERADLNEIRQDEWDLTKLRGCLKDVERNRCPEGLRARQNH